MPYSWDTAPRDVRGQVGRIEAALDRLLGENLVGLYLHGSLSMGCFNPRRSDLDLLAVTHRPLDAETQGRVFDASLAESRAPIPLEMSVLAWSDLHPWRYPPPYELHVSEFVRDRVQRGDSDLPLSTPSERRRDVDLASHITHLRDRGVRLRGAPIADVFPAIPLEDYRASILGDYEDILENLTGNPLYSVLNPCRVWRHLQEGTLSSKEEGGVWALSRVPADLRGVVANALAEYRGDHFAPVAGADLARYADFMARRITALHRERPPEEN